MKTLIAWIKSFFAKASPIPPREPASLPRQPSEQPTTAIKTIAGFQIKRGHRSNWSDVITLPKFGNLICESHYCTARDFKLFGGRYPQTNSEEIYRHLETSIDALKTAGFDVTLNDVYNTRYKKEWTPPENGKAGQGAKGEIFQIVWEEMWQGNMMFASGALPKMGSKFLVTNPLNGRQCVINMGFEIGPNDQKILGGVTPEVHWWLKSNNETLLKLEKIENDLVASGPVREEIKPSIPVGPDVESFLRTKLLAKWMRDVGQSETGGANRSPMIDAINRAMSELGDPYCISGLLYRGVREICQEYDLANPVVMTPSTQEFFDKTPSKYKTPKGGLAKKADIGIMKSRSNSSQGHAYGLREDEVKGKDQQTVEYNTNTAGSRDGEGVHSKTRTQDGDILKVYRGSVDVVRWIMDVNPDFMVPL